MHDVYFRIFSFANDEIEVLSKVVRHRIVVATCTTSGGIYKLGLSEGHFTHCFIDEAGETTEPESMIPIGKMHALKNVQFHEIYVTKIMNKTRGIK